MELFEAIYHRQSVGKVKADPVSVALIEKLLEAAAQAPNHHKVRPWRFLVLTGSGRERLGQAMAASLQVRKPDVLPEAVAVEAARALRAPVVIAVAADLPSEPKVDLIENICACAAAAQNLLLAAEGLGLAAIWRTGPAARDAQVKEALGLQADQPIVGFIYVGYPEAERPAAERPDHRDRTTWVG
jgi:nitroreductase